MAMGRGPWLELHMLSPRSDAAIVELLTSVAHYHVNGAQLGMFHSVNFGRPWLPGSHADHGLISLPYPFGESLEVAEITGQQVRCYWLLPITKAEFDFKKKHGVDALEEAFEKAGLDYLDVERASVV